MELNLQIAFPAFHILIALCLSMCHKSADCRQLAYTDLSANWRNRSFERDNSSSFFEAQCVMSQPSSADVGHFCQREMCDVIQCIHIWYKISSSSRQRSPNTVCFNKVCNVFDISTRNGMSAESTSFIGHANINDLQTTIDSLLTKFPNVIKVKEHINLKCVDVNSVLFGENLQVQVNSLSEAVLSKVDNFEHLTESKENYQKSINIHLFYFRFVSRWESFIKFPKWHATMELVKRSSEWTVLSNDNFQSTSLVLENNLGLFFGTTVKNTDQNNNTDTNLIHLAIKHGRCISFNFIGCHRSSNINKLQKMIMSPENLENCAESYSRYSMEETPNVTSCWKDTNDFSLDIEMRRLLNDVVTKKSSNIFSIFIINVPDLHSKHSLDQELTDITSSLLLSHRGISVFVSDVGDPQFSRLDASIFLRQQTFNPFLVILFPTELNISIPYPYSTYRETESSSHIPKLIGLSDIYHFLKTVVVTHNDEEKSNYSTTDSGDRTNASSLESNILRGPVESLCEGNLVNFPNDSIQLAFASFAIGSINNYFLDLSFKSKNNDLVCGRLTGVQFGNVRHFLLGNSTYINTTVLVTSEPYGKVTGRILRLDLHLRYTVNNGMIFNLYIKPFGKYHSTFPLYHKNTARLHQAFCRRKTLLQNYKMYSSSSQTYGHFGASTKVKPLSVSCLILMTTKFADSTVLEISNNCPENGYDLTLSAELLDTISLMQLPVKVTVRQHEVRYISTLVKAYYGATLSAYKLSFKITPSTD